MNDTSTIKPGVRHQAGHFGHATDVLDAVSFREAEILVEAVTHVVAVEQVGVPPERVQPLFQQVGNGRLAGARQTRKPDDAGAADLSCPRARTLVDVERLPVDVVGAAQREVQQAGANGGVC